MENTQSFSLQKAFFGFFVLAVNFGVSSFFLLSSFYFYFFCITFRIHFLNVSSFTCPSLSLSLFMSIVPGFYLVLSWFSFMMLFLCLFGAFPSSSSSIHPLSLSITLQQKRRERRPRNSKTNTIQKGLGIEQNKTKGKLYGDNGPDGKEEAERVNETGR